jgi:hypothetical protein
MRAALLLLLLISASASLIRLGTVVSPWGQGASVGVGVGAGVAENEYNRLAADLSQYAESLKQREREIERERLFLDTFDPVTSILLASNVLLVILVALNYWNDFRRGRRREREESGMVLRL